MAPGPITSWEIDGETVETVSDKMTDNNSNIIFVLTEFCGE